MALVVSEGNTDLVFPQPTYYRLVIVAPLYLDRFGKTGCTGSDSVGGEVQEQSRLMGSPPIVVHLGKLRQERERILRDRNAQSRARRPQHFAQNVRVALTWVGPVLRRWPSFVVLHLFQPIPHQAFERAAILLPYGHYGADRAVVSVRGQARLGQG